MLIKNFKYIFFIKIGFLAIAALLAIYVKSNFYKTTKSENYDNTIVFAIDISHSMNVRDIDDTSRLDISKNFIKDKLSLYSGQNKDINVGVILFSNKSNYFMPPTKDYKTLKKYIKELNTNYLPNGETNISKVLNKFINSSSEGIKGFLLSDLGNKQNIKNLDKLKKSFNKKDLSLNIIGVGTSKGGYVTYPDGSFVRNNGEKVIDKLNNNLGQKLSNKFNGKYYKLQSNYERKEINLLETNSIGFKNNKKTKKVLESLIGVFTAIGL